MDKKLIFIKDLRKVDYYLIYSLYKFCKIQNLNVDDVILNETGRIKQEIAKYNANAREYLGNNRHKAERVRSNRYNHSIKKVI